MIVNIRDCGAVGDGVTKDTLSLQTAINHCSEQGGGTVLVPGGNFLSGKLILRSNVNLHLEAAARIISSIEEADFTSGMDGGVAGAEIGADSRALLCARHSRGISITGLGTIDGRGELFLEPEEDDADYVLLPLGPFRPKLVDLEGCTNVVIRDVTLYRASSWGLHLTGCEQVTIQGIKILGQQRGPNNDGIDPDCCKNVHISDCHIETGDDCIVVKTTKYGAERYGACENITISGCTLMSHDSAIKIGTETHADIRNIVVTNCVIRNSNRGIGLWARDGAIIENMLFSNIIIETRLFSDEEEISRPLRWWGKGEPIFISAERRNHLLPPGKIKNIRFDHISSEAEGCVYLEGSEESIIEGISIRALRHTMRKKSGYPGGLFDTQPSERGVFPHSVPAIFFRYAHKISLIDVEVEWIGDRNAHWTNALYSEHVEDLIIRGFSGAAASGNHSTLEIKHAKGITLEGCKSAAGTGVYLALEHVNPSEVFLTGNDLTKAQKAVHIVGLV